MKTIGLNTALKESATLAINQTAIKLRSSGKSIAHLGFGQSPFPVPKLIQSALKDAAARHEYLPTFGLTELRETFCQYYNKNFKTSFSAENTIIGPGSKELIFQILMASDATVMVPAPSWVSYAPQAHILKKKLSYLKTRYEDRFLITADLLEKSCQENPSKDKILILNSPSNPTGQVYTSKELEAIVPVLKKYNVTVISDEIYADLCFDGTRATSISTLYPERTIVTTGLSKAFSAGGYRLGIASLPAGFKELLSDLKVLISETYSCVSTPIQVAAIEAYKSHKEIKDYLSLTTSVHKFAINYMYENLVRCGFSAQPGQGGFYLFPNLNAHKKVLNEIGINNSSDLALYLLEHYEVATLPGSDFYQEGDDFSLRMAIVDYEGESLLEALKAGESLDQDFLEKYAPKLKLAAKNFERFFNDKLKN